MKREIKFRGLRIDGGGWVYGLIVKSKSKHLIDIEFKDIEGDIIYRSYEVNPDSLGQFTGLRDKKGVDIYEFDIVKFSTRRHHLGKEKGLQTITFKSDVIFDEGCFVISEQQQYDSYLYAHNNVCEVIGNIHEN